MKAILFTAQNEVTYCDIPHPKVRPDEVIIAVKACGICHTDFEVLKANYGTSVFPIVSGHEYAGVVVDIGADVKDVSIGDRVAVDPNIECGHCRSCKRGWAHLCETLGAYGVTQHGGFAEMSIVKASAIVPIGDISFAQAALAEPMGCVLNGLDAAFEPWMEDVLIFGAGLMGLLFAIALKVNGVPNVAVADIDDTRLERAKSLGFHAIESKEDTLASWRHSADLTVDATGVPAVASRLIDYTANGGKISFFGVCPSEARIEISPFEIFRRQLTIVGSHSLNHNIPQALQIIKDYGPSIEALITHRLPLEEVGDILSSRPPRGSLKVHAVFDA